MLVARVRLPGPGRGGLGPPECVEILTVRTQRRLQSVPTLMTTGAGSFFAL
jgi:hypothetical protein